MTFFLGIAFGGVIVTAIFTMVAAITRRWLLDNFPRRDELAELAYRQHPSARGYAVRTVDGQPEVEPRRRTALGA